MKHAHHLLLIIVTVVLVAACVSRQTATEITEPVPEIKPVPEKETIKKEKPVPEVEIVRPAPGSKFSKLKIGMPLKQVEELIGTPSRHWQHPTEKASIPFYFGPDRWVIQYVYTGEGVLTFNYGEEQLLTHIEVNKAE